MNEKLLERVNKIKASLNGDKIAARISEIEQEMQVDGFWNNQEKSSKLTRELSGLKKEKDNLEMLDFLILEDSETDLEQVVDELEVRLYLSGRFDKNDARVWSARIYYGA